MRTHSSPLLSAEDDRHRRTLCRSPAVSSAQLRTGLARRQFIPFFQPVVTVQTGALHGLEATVRWAHPRLGLLAPSDFLCEADQYGLLDSLVAQWMAAVREAAAGWRVSGLSVGVSLHLSGAMLRTQTVHGNFAEVLEWEPPRTWRTGVDTVLDWYRLLESGAELAQGDFVCAPQPAAALPSALHVWRARFQAANATRFLPFPCFF
ncbi:MAG: EAL domain-containing protein [Pseudomonadota bacterium]